MLRAARVASQKDIPVFGVNMGRFGFLSEVKPDTAIKVLPKVLEGHYKLDERMMVQANVFRGSKKAGQTFALNDIVITKAGIARLIRFNVYVDGMLVRTHNADGIIISTPTGSTAYNISVGGPIVYPTTPTFIISPICPHSMSDRPIVMSARKDQELVKVEVKIDKSPGELGTVLLTADGQQVIKLKEKDRIVFSEAPIRTKFIRLKEYDFFKVLRSKLKWD
jgi:NAD+ kinase